jgi:hypothetical protein
MLQLQRKATILRASVFQRTSIYALNVTAGKRK